MVEYPVNLKLILSPKEKNKLKNLDASANVSQKGGGSADSKTSKKDSKQNYALLGKIAGSVGIIAIILKVLQPIIQFVGDLLNVLGGVLLGSLVYVFDSIIKFLPKLFTAEFWVGIATAIWGKIKTIWDWLKEKFPILQVIQTFLTDLFNQVVAFFKDPLGNLLGWLDSLWSWLKEQFPFLATIQEWVMKAWDVAVSIWDGIKSFFDDPAGMIASGLKGLWDWLTGKFPIIETIKDKAVQIFSNIVTAVKAFFNDPIGTLKQAFEVIKGWLFELPNKIWNLLKGLGSIIAGAIKGAFNIGSSFFGGGSSGSRQFGGIVGSTGMYKLHSGETVSRGASITKNMNPTININVSGGYGEDMTQKLARQMTTELRAFRRW